MNSNIIIESPSDTIRIARFLRPDVREALYDQEAIPETSLYKELHAGAISGLPKGGTVILNFGLIDWFPTAFYRILIQALQDARGLGGRIVLCCLTENVKEGFEMMAGRKLFEVFSTEARAIAACQGQK
jgi:anti-anti-sigma regulatory factor